MRKLSLLLSFLVLGCSSAEVVTRANTERLIADITFVDLSNAGVGKCPDKLNDADFKIWQSTVRLANNCVGAKKWNQVDAVGEKFVENFPHSPWGFYYMSLAADERGDSIRALWLLDKATEKDKSLALLYYQRARVLLKANELEPARKDFEKAINLDDALPDAHLYLGKFALRDQNFKMAEKHFRSVLKFEPFNRDALFGSAQSLLQGGDVKTAIDYADRVLSKNKKDIEVRVFKAHLLEVYTQNITEALAEYKLLSNLVRENRTNLISYEDIQKKIKTLENQVNARRIAGASVGGKK